MVPGIRHYRTFRVSDTLNFRHFKLLQLTPVTFVTIGNYITKTIDRSTKACNLSLSWDS